MKTERRHELQQNELNQMLTQGAAWFQKHGMTVLWAIAGVAVVFAGYHYMRNRSDAAVTQAYDIFGNLTYSTREEATSSIEQLKNSIGKVDDQGFQLRSLSYQAGLASMFAVDQKTGAVDKEMVELARSAYEETLRRFPNAPLEVGSALFGLATVEENLFTLDHDPSHKTKAKGHLEQIVADKRLAATPLSKSAVDRLNRLDHTFQVIQFAEAPPPPPTVEMLPVSPDATGETAVPNGDSAPADAPEKPSEPDTAASQPAEGAAPPTDGATPPTEGAAPPMEGEAPPADNTGAKPD